MKVGARRDFGSAIELLTLISLIAGLTFTILNLMWWIFIPLLIVFIVYVVMWCKDINDLGKK